MCFDTDSRPPITPIAGGAVDSRRLDLTSADGAHPRAFAADASAPTGAGIIVLPDVRGLHHYYEELTLRFAEAGVDAIAIDYFARTAGESPRGDDFDHMSHVQQTTWDGLRADVLAGAAELRATRAPRALFTVGFCFAGRLSFDLATVRELGATGVIGFYGPPVGAGRGNSPVPADVAAQMQGVAVLGLFGGADAGIPPEAVATFEGALTSAGVEHRLITYPDAPHSFFDRKYEEFTDASAAAWGEVLDFIHLNTPEG